MKAHVDFDCLEADCGATIEFDLLTLRDSKGLIGCPTCRRQYQFAKDFLGKLEKLKQLRGGARLHGKTMCHNESGERVEVKLGIYRNERYNKSTFDYHWIHDPRVGLSYDAVAPR